MEIDDSADDLRRENRERKRYDAHINSSAVFFFFCPVNAVLLRYFFIAREKPGEVTSSNIKNTPSASKQDEVFLLFRLVRHSTVSDKQLGIIFICNSFWCS